jgi:hypothetical protein
VCGILGIKPVKSFISKARITNIPNENNNAPTIRPFSLKTFAVSEEVAQIAIIAPERSAINRK